MTRAESRTHSSSPEKIAPASVDIRPLFAPIDEILVCGGDQRLTLSRPARRNMYGCTPAPCPGLIDFASSTASSISEEAYARALAARSEYLARVAGEGSAGALEAMTRDLRLSLLAQLQLQDSGTGTVFAASGTDAQIDALFVAKALLGTPLTTIVVGSDQTGSGTAFTARGQHFSNMTAGGGEAGKGGPIAGLTDGIRKLDIPFYADGAFRTPAEMDDAVLEAAETVIAEGSAIVLQTMDASKFGWRAPSDACVAQIAERWPGRVQVVVDACQLRISPDRLAAALGKGFIVLVTGSKFFTGPAFSGALLLPQALGAKLARIGQVPPGLSAYSAQYDWPAALPAIRRQLPARANFGQWLRWEAALEEMRLYHAVPQRVRDDMRALLADRIERQVAASPCLRLLRFGAVKDTTMFPVLPHRDGLPLPAAQCAVLYQAMRRDLSAMAETDSDRRIAHAPCQIGQPVPLAEGAALRISLSARTIRQCWSAQDDIAQANTGRTLEDIATLIEKLNFAIRHIDRVASP